MTQGYDGTIRFNTRIYDEELQPGLDRVKNRLKQAAGTMRDLMQGPVAVFHQVKQAVSGLSSTIASMEAEFAAGEQAVAILHATLRATGASSWTSAEAVQAMADKFQAMTGYADDVVLSMQNVLLGFKNIKGDNFEAASLQIINMARVMKMDLASAAQAVGKALDDPIAGIDSLTRQGFRWNEQEKEMLKTMVEAGKTAEAQKIIIDALATTFGGAAEAANNTASAIKDKLNVAQGELKEEMGRFITEALKPLRLELIGATGRFTDWFKTINENGNAAEILEGIAIGLASVTGGVIAFMAVAKGHAIVTALAAAIKAVGMAITANPIGLVAAAITMILIPAIIFLVKNWDDVVQVFKETIAKVGASFKILGSEIEEAFVVGFNGAKIAVLNLAQAVTGPVLKGISKLLDVLGKLPFVGGLFNDAAAAVRGFNDNLQGSIDKAKADSAQAIATAKAKQDAIEATQKAELFAIRAAGRARREEREAAEREAKNFKTTIDGLTPAEDSAAPAAGTSSSKKDKDKTPAERLADLDAEFAAKIDLARIRGEDTVAIEAAWYKKRLDLLEDFVVENKQKGIEVAESLKKSLGGAYLTIGAEVNNTIEKQKILADAAKFWWEESPEYMTHDARIAAMEQETKDQLTALQDGADQVKGIEDYLADKALQEYIAREQQKTAEQIKALKEGVALVEAAEWEKASIEGQLGDQALDDYIKREQAKTAEHIKLLNEGVALLGKSEEEKAAIEAQIREQTHAERKSALEKETEDQIRGLNEGVALIAKKDAEAEAIANQVREQAHQETLAAMQKQNDENLAALKEGGEKVIAMEDFLREQAHQETIAAMAEETRKQIQGLEEGASLVGKTEAEAAAIEAQIRDQAHEEKILALAKETEAQILALREGVDKVAAQEKEAAAIAEQAREQAHNERMEEMRRQNEENLRLLKEGAAILEEQELASVEHTHEAKIAAMAENNNELLRLLKEGAAIIASNEAYFDQLAFDQMIAAMTKSGEEQIQALREGVALLEVRAMEAEFKVLGPTQRNTPAGSARGPGSESIARQVREFSEFGRVINDIEDAWGKLVADIKKDAEDWSDVLGDVSKAVEDQIAGSFETLGRSIVEGGDAWDGWGTSALRALAGVLRSVGYQLLAQAAYNAVLGVTRLLFGDVAGFAAAAASSAVALAAAAGAFVGAGVIEAMADQYDKANEAISQHTDALQEQNNALQESRDLFTKASMAAAAYAAVLAKVSASATDFYEGLQNTGADITDKVIDGLTQGFGREDFLYAMQEYITESVVKAAVFTDAFMAEAAQIGKEIAAGIAGGFRSDQLQGLKDRLAGLYEQAATAAEIATGVIQSAFGSYDVGTLNVRGDQLARIHNREMILEPGIAEQARTSGIHIGPISSMGDVTRGSMAPAAAQIHISATGTLEVEGREIGRIAFQFADEFQGKAYGY